jgi:hypothetical protein
MNPHSKKKNDDQDDQSTRTHDLVASMTAVQQRK